MIRVYVTGIVAPNCHSVHGGYFAPGDDHELTALINSLRASTIREIVITGVPQHPLLPHAKADGIVVKRRRRAWGMRTEAKYYCRGRVLSDVLDMRDLLEKSSR